MKKTLKKLDDPKFTRKLHAWLALIWLVLSIPIMLFLSSSIPFVVFISVYAIVAGHWSAFEAAGGEGDIDSVRDNIQKILDRLDKEEEMHRILDWKPRFDEKSKQFPIREIVPQKPRSYTWRVQKWLDQGQEGACVGFGWGHNLIARPKEHLEVTDTYAHDKIYNLAKTLDEWPGEDYEGTSVLAGAKAVQKLGMIKEYRWAFGIDDVVQAIGHAGPVVLGINWYNDMFTPDEKGFIHPTGGLAGGHCILAKGVNIKGQYVILRNSWGPDWGTNGDCKISFADLSKLLSEDGEACIAIGEK